MSNYYLHAFIIKCQAIVLMRYISVFNINKMGIIKLKVGLKLLFTVFKVLGLPLKFG